MLDNREEGCLQARLETRVGQGELGFPELCRKAQGLHLRKGMMWAWNHSLDSWRWSPSLARNTSFPALSICFSPRRSCREKGHNELKGLMEGFRLTTMYSIRLKVHFLFSIKIELYCWGGDASFQDFVWVFEIRSCFIVQAGLNLAAILPQPPKWQGIWLFYYYAWFLQLPLSIKKTWQLERWLSG